MANIKELLALGNRVYTNKMEVKKDEKGEVIYNDTDDITALVNKTFNSGSPSLEKLHIFNEVAVKTAETIAEPKLQQILNLFANYETVADGTIKVLKLQKKGDKPHLIFTADGTGVDYVRLSAEVKETPAVPKKFSVGAYYELSDFSGNAVEAFRNVVDKIADALIEFYFEQVTKLINSAVTAGKIPAKNCHSGANVTLAEFKAVENTMIRLGGGRPVMVADQVLIEALQGQQVTVAKDLLTDDLRKSLREDLYLERVSKTTAVNLANPFTTEENNEVAFAVNEGYVFPSGATKAIEITRYGAITQFSDFDSETERVMLKIKMKNSIDLVNAREIGVIKDTALSL